MTDPEFDRQRERQQAALTEARAMAANGTMPQATFALLTSRVRQEAIWRTSHDAYAAVRKLYNEGYRRQDLQPPEWWMAGRAN